MPITGPSSWLSTIDEFSAHWVQVNAALTAPLVLTTAYAVATLGTARTTLSTSMTTLSTGINDRQIAEATVVQSEATARGKIGDFNRAVRAFLGTTAYAPALGEVPAKGAAQGKYEKAMDDTSSLWVKINSVTLPTFTPPLVLRGGYTQGSFGTLVSSLKVAYTTATAAGRNEKVQLELRNAAFDVIRPRLVEYRKAVIASFAPGSPLVLSLPKLYPPSGTTPDAVSAAGLWDAVVGKAKLQWSASEEPELAHYSIRFCAGTTYRAENEQVAGLAEPGTLMFETEAGLVSAGLKAAFKVYVVLASGNERGSNVVKIARP